MYYISSNRDNTYIYINGNNDQDDFDTRKITDINKQIEFIITQQEQKIKVNKIRIRDKNIEEDNINIYDIDEYIIIQFCEMLDIDILNYCSVEILYNKIYIYRDDYGDIVEIAIYTS